MSDEPLSKCITIRLPQSLADELAAEAKSCSRSMSQYLRLWICEHKKTSTLTPSMIGNSEPSNVRQNQPLENRIYRDI